MEDEERPAGGQARETESAVQGLQYNHRMMDFLKVQLDRVKGLQKPPCAQLDEWESFKQAAERGHRLWHKHARPFDIRKFYRINFAQRAVDEICEHLKAKTQEWQVDGGIEHCVPKEYVEEDRKYLHKLLAYILKGEESGVDDEVLCQWLSIKRRHEEEVRSLPIIREDALVLKEQLGVGGYGLVCIAEWNSTVVAVKKPLREGDLPIEEFASFVKEVMVHAKLHHPNIAQVYATTPSGWLVMEAADTNLGSLYRGKKRFDWRCTVNLLLQAAKGLCHLHSLDPKVVHSDVKTSNFLVFGKEPGSYTVKVTDFGLAFEASSSRSKSERLGGGTLEWMAPELFCGEPASASSDVYSFGVVMYALVTGAHPYGADKLRRHRHAEAILMCKKLHEKAEPCELGPDNCPGDMQTFMQRCCAIDPAERPTMEDICKFLEELPADWNRSSQIQTGLLVSGANETNQRVAEKEMDVKLEIVKVCEDLAIKMEERVNTAEQNSEAKKILAERIEVIKAVLGEIRKQHKKWKAAQTSALSGEIQEQQAMVTTEPPGEINEQQKACELEQALRCVQGQLERATDMFEKMDNDGRLKKFWVVKGGCDELSDLDRSLQGAIRVLHKAHTALLGDTVNQTHQRVQNVVTILKALSLDQKNMAEEVRQALRQALAEKLVGSECSEDEEQPPNEVTSTPSANPLSPEECVRYNREMLQFLMQQMEAFMSIFSTQEFYAAARTMPDGWANSVQNTYGALELGWMLIDRHKKPFNLSTFYKNCEAQEAVNMICGTIKKFLDKWGFSIENIQESVPQDAVKADKEQLQEYLAYVLKDGSCSFGGLPESVKKEWEHAKVTTGLLLDMVKVPNTDEDIKEIRHIAGSVYEGRWDGSPVAVKKLLKDNDSSKLELEDFAQFYTEAVALARLKSPHIVTFRAATESGRLVMELGKEQLLKWYEARQKDSAAGLPHEGLPLRLRLLLQAAQALRDVHTQQFIHRDVSTGKFVVFENEGTPKVKIVGFGLAIVRTETGSQTLRRHIDETPAWVAPEIFNGKQCKFASDIYSFGVVMYHVVTGVYPYGRRTAVGDLMKRKEAGHKPCAVNQNVKALGGLEEIMVRCTETDPGARYGSMEDVCNDLEAVISKAGWSG